MGDDPAIHTDSSIGPDSKRGKTTPANAREGALLIIRALCQIVGKPVEPYVVGAFLAAALDECGSASSAIREAAEDSAGAIVALANPWSFAKILSPLILQALQSTEWRVKSSTLERLEQCTVSAPAQVQKMIPTLIPALTNQVWDTKAQVSKAARSTLVAICKTNLNKDIAPTLPAVVNAICKPADTNKAVSELMSTTFVVPVDASTLSILCPILARALKEKLAIHKRAACIVISNMSKLVETPEAIAPFGSLLVPELKKVANNVQFTEIRDEALKALASLTKALGEAYVAPGDEKDAKEIDALAAQVKAEEDAIREAREAEAKLQAEILQKEEEERKKFREAMDAQRELDKIAAEDALTQKGVDDVELNRLRLSTKLAGGQCQGCGLKKCRKTCNFYVEN
jgi:elongation factor 3